FWRIFSRGCCLALCSLPGQLGLRRSRFLPALRPRVSRGFCGVLGSLRLRRRGGLGLRLLLIVLLNEPDSLQLGELAEVRHHAELGHEPFLVRLADVRELDLDGPSFRWIFNCLPSP